MEHAAQLLVQTLVKTRLDYCNALLVGLPSSTIKPLQMIHNAAARLSSTSQKEPMLHLYLSPCTGYRLQLASSSKHCLHIEQPQAQHPPTSTHWWQSTSPPEVWDPLVSDASLYLYLYLFEQCLRLTSLHAYKHFLCLFAFLRWIASGIPQL